MTRNKTATLLLVLAALGCPGEIDDPTPFLNATGTCVAIDTDLFPNRCGQASCHNADDQMGMLDLVSPNVASRIVGVDGSSACNGQVLADPANATGSLIYQKLSSTPPCGTQMPVAGAKLSPDELTCVEQYIESLPTGGPGAGGGGSGGDMGGAGGDAGAGGAAGGAAGMGGAAGAGG